MLMSRSAISAALTGWPSPGPLPGGAPVVVSAVAHAASRTAGARAGISASVFRLKIDIRDAPVGVHAPGLDRVVVIAIRPGVHSVPCVAGRLDVAFLVRRA